jgi:hypothetical protein
MAARKWTDSELAMIGTMPHGELAAILGRTVLSVKKRAHYSRHHAKLRQEALDYYYRNQEKAIARARAWNAKNKSRRRETERNWRLRNPEKERARRARTWQKHRERYAAERKQWRKENAQHVKARFARYYARNRDTLLSAQRRWFKANPEVKRQCDKRSIVNRRSRERQFQLLKLQFQLTEKTTNDTGTNNRGQ